MQMREPIFDIDSFARRHIGPNEEEVREMLREVGFHSLGEFIDALQPCARHRLIRAHDHAVQTGLDV